MRSFRVFAARSIVLASLSGVLLLVLPTVANANLIGDSVACSGSGIAGSCNPAVATVVDPGAEFALSNQLSIDVLASSIIISTQSFPFQYGNAAGVTISDLDVPGDIIGVNLLGPVSGLDDGDISFTADSVSVVLTGSLWNLGASSILSLVVSGAPVPVPVPTALTLLVAGVCAAGVAAVASPRHRQ